MVGVPVRGGKQLKLRSTTLNGNILCDIYLIK
jgi:hypothetical protein